MDFKMWMEFCSTMYAIGVAKEEIIIAWEKYNMDNSIGLSGAIIYAISLRNEKKDIEQKEIIE